jgi:hypothetical protein
MNPERNKETYNLTMHPVDAPQHPDIIKGVLKNTREQSPWNEGNRNKGWINPTLASNVLFYNHGLEEASNHHAQAKKVNKKGYNLNHYVVYDALPGQEQTQRSTAAPREKSDKASVDKRPNKALSVHQNESEAPRGSAQERQVSPIASEKRIGIDRSRSPVDAKSLPRAQARPQTSSSPMAPLDARPPRPASPIHQEQRSSSRIERAYDRTQRSGSANSQVDRVLNKSVSQQDIRSPSRSAHNLANPTDPNAAPLIEQRVGLSRSNSAVSVQKYGDFLRATNSNISNPDALICDFCVNKDMTNAKVDKANALRRQDIEHAAAVDNEIQRQVDDERRRHHQKLLTYQEQIDAQKTDLEHRRQKNKEVEGEENRKIRSMIEENNYMDWKRLQQQQEQKQRYLSDLEDQLGRTYEARQQKALREAEEDRSSPNLLINDADRDMHRRAKMDHYKRNIKSQLEEQVRDKSGKREAEQAENDAYRKKVQEMINKDIDARRNMVQAKREAFVTEIDRHVALRDQIRAKERDVKAVEMDNLAQKLAYDRQQQLEKAQMKKNQMTNYIKSLGNQIADKEAEKQARAELDKQLHNGTLLIPQKHDRCYNCAKCRNQYPIKLLNKQRKLAKV